MHLVDDLPSCWLLYFLLLHGPDKTQPGGNKCPRLQFLALSLDAIVSLSREVSVLPSNQTRIDRCFSELELRASGMFWFKIGPEGFEKRLAHTSLLYNFSGSITPGFQRVVTKRPVSKFGMLCFFL